MSESLIVEVRRLREAQARIQERLTSLLTVLTGMAAPDDLEDVLDQLDLEVERLQATQEE